MPAKERIDDFADFAHDLADMAQTITLRSFRTVLSIENKEDSSPVTEADKAVENLLRQAINDSFPSHGIIGEEYGAENEKADFIWVIDPIDGTASFINGVPLFTTLIGLLKEGEPFLGLIDQPVLKDRWVGGVGYNTRYNGKIARTRKCDQLSKAYLYITAPDIFSADESIRIEKLEKEVKLRRYGGTDCYHYGMLASGWTDMVCERLHVYEFSAMIPIIEGAGGIITDWRGMSLEGFDEQGVIALGDPRLHEDVLYYLS